jgi:hypothetical protein
MDLKNFPAITRAMSEYTIAHGLLSALQAKLRSAQKLEEACSDVSAHKPECHQRAFIAAIEAGICAAYDLRLRSELIGDLIDVVLPLALCDIGKVRGFLAGQNVYGGFELISTKVAAHSSPSEISADDLLLILLHTLSYQAKAESIINWARKNRPQYIGEKFGINPCLQAPSRDSNDLWLKRLLGVFACRCFARGWTPAQRIQKPKEAELIREICRLKGWVDLGEMLCEKFVLAE